MTGIGTKEDIELASTEDLESVKRHWESETAGTRYSSSTESAKYYSEVRAARYELEPFIKSFAGFETARALDVLEIGVGAGADFSNWIAAGANATGIDLTAASISHTRGHLDSLGVESGQYVLQQANAEELPFSDESFDLVYSWGVLHHSPRTDVALTEVQRVLRPGGQMKIMVYNKNSWSAWMMWGIHGLLKGRPFKSPKACVFEHLESPGTKSYSIGEASGVVSGVGFDRVRISTVLGPGDLLTIKRSDRYSSMFSRIAFAVYPRWMIRALGDRFGLYMLISAEKS